MYKVHTPGPVQAPPFTHACSHTLPHCPLPPHALQVSPLPTTAEAAAALRAVASAARRSSLSAALCLELAQGPAVQGLVGGGGGPGGGGGGMVEDPCTCLTAPIPHPLTAPAGAAHVCPPSNTLPQQVQRTCAPPLTPCPSRCSARVPPL